MRVEVYNQVPNFMFSKGFQTKTFANEYIELEGNCLLTWQIQSPLAQIQPIIMLDIAHLRLKERF